MTQKQLSRQAGHGENASLRFLYPDSPFANYSQTPVRLRGKTGVFAPIIPVTVISDFHTGYHISKSIFYL